MMRKVHYYEDDVKDNDGNESLYTTEVQSCYEAQYTTADDDDDDEQSAILKLSNRGASSLLIFVIIISFLS